MKNYLFKITNLIRFSIFILYSQLGIRILLRRILLVVLLTLSKKRWLRFSKRTPFECGFWPYKRRRLPFSLQFFL